MPSGSFESNCAYECAIEWESGGLAEKAEFYANFISGRGPERKKQLTTWKGAAGKTGTIAKALTTDDSDQWQLAVGVRGSGHLIVKRIRIRKK